MRSAAGESECSNPSPTPTTDVARVPAPLFRGGLVKLNVGGKRFVTTEGTLQQGSPSFFDGILTGRLLLPQDEEGFLFIDRNGRYFEYILDYLRSGTWDVPSSLDRHVKRECRFYSLSPEPSLIADPLLPNDEVLREITEDAREKNRQQSIKERLEARRATLEPLAREVLHVFLSHARKGTLPSETFHFYSQPDHKRFRSQLNACAAVIVPFDRSRWVPDEATGLPTSFDEKDVAELSCWLRHFHGVSSKVLQSESVKLCFQQPQARWRIHSGACEGCEHTQAVKIVWFSIQWTAYLKSSTKP
ncbi:unnamed protein product [Vitrella brassicaformis CCMP3155]|uniref:BTB domain-containing protein n=2 Tax=Vitrella brassicaformis TaxID=1169539 RepID=A0A0G4FC78_VITBC|nr:unnamed protein product [Vitrella brassicaformis CCMP3155]|mmetsp:Transcript_26972/g.67160  ORF Transcript_26972/g.67160 Transcript_26972/m.67160 type:complete len:303 (+) Transcript_26972:42-950(+)|eukprot:CEM10785.1 unnamed protein product [Vitrella brassicaformis CCMP3155]